jgi:hypothetical protein
MCELRVSGIKHVLGFLEKLEQTQLGPCTTDTTELSESFEHGGDMEKWSFKDYFCSDMKCKLYYLKNETENL